MRRRTTAQSSHDAAGSAGGVTTRQIDIERELDRLETLSLEELRSAWIKRFDSEPPRFKTRELSLRLFAWIIQAEAFGDHHPSVKRRLTLLAAALEKDPTHPITPTLNLKPGIVLTREWKGVVHRVLVQRDGFIYDERSYRSLSEVARVITGTRWSGPRFFGLEQKVRGQFDQEGRNEPT